MVKIDVKTNCGINGAYVPAKAIYSGKLGDWDIYSLLSGPMRNRVDSSFQIVESVTINAELANLLVGA